MESVQYVYLYIDIYLSIPICRYIYIYGTPLHDYGLSWGCDRCGRCQGIHFGFSSRGGAICVAKMLAHPHAINFTDLYIYVQGAISHTSSYVHTQPLS